MPSPGPLRLATWNVNSLPARLPRVSEWLARVAPDVLCLQETKVSDAAFPHAQLAELGYETAADGDGGYNGVAILSRVGLERVTRGFAGEPGFPQDERERRAIGATCGGLRVWSLYAPNGRSLDSPAFAYKLAWLTALALAARAELTGTTGTATTDRAELTGTTGTTATDRAELAGTTAPERVRARETQPPLALCGDFNVAPADEDVWDPREFTDSTHVSPAEREAIDRLVQLGLSDLRPRALKGEPFTYWDYRAGMFHRGCGMRIDLVLLDERLRAGVRDAYVDRDARKGHKPSDHAPVVVDVDLGASAG